MPSTARLSLRVSLRCMMYGIVAACYLSGSALSQCFKHMCGRNGSMLCKFTRPSPRMEALEDGRSRRSGVLIEKQRCTVIIMKALQEKLKSRRRGRAL